jgi:hypothetical protein
MERIGRIGPREGITPLAMTEGMREQPTGTPPSAASIPHIDPLSEIDPFTEHATVPAVIILRNDQQSGVRE